MPESTAPLPPTVQSAGELDAQFGLRTLKFPGAAKTIAEGVSITPSGKIMVSATVEQSGHSYYGLARLDADGNPDPAFGDGGYLNGEFGTGSLTQGGPLIVDALGRFWMCGVIGVVKDQALEYQQVIARFLPDGSPDIEFGGDSNGYRIVPMRIPALFGATHGQLLLAKSDPQLAQPDRLLFVTAQKGSGLLTRFHLDGSDDLSFASNGWLPL
ncbi:hypothetical protein [Pseudomonas moraviensis]|uniref:hypothetical protein n=2 Tax=Pseudomonas TaxID=286 RepID=UPI0021AE1FE9|nr:hypothetical protein [Pseudomonas moraviensis]